RGTPVYPDPERGCFFVLRPIRESGYLRIDAGVAGLSVVQFSTELARVPAERQEAASDWARALNRPQAGLTCSYRPGRLILGTWVDASGTFDPEQDILSAYERLDAVIAEH